MRSKLTWVPIHSSGPSVTSPFHPRVGALVEHLHVEAARFAESQLDGAAGSGVAVLVCPITTPACSLNFGRIGAHVTDAGGALSHASSVAREPRHRGRRRDWTCDHRLRDGQMVTVDGVADTVTLAEVAASGGGADSSAAR